MLFACLIPANVNLRSITDILPVNDRPDFFWSEIFRQHCQQQRYRRREHPRKLTTEAWKDNWVAENSELGQNWKWCYGMFAWYQINDSYCMWHVLPFVWSFGFMQIMCKVCKGHCRLWQPISIVFCVSLADESPCDAKPEWRILTSTSCLNVLVVFIKVDRRCKWSFVIYRRAGQLGPGGSMKHQFHPYIGRAVQGKPSRG